ncbi:hypothetical protein K435DRAFT_740384 [Dendrothele bispora CBS 962.96]|uniref:Pre-rRNA-processing protein RIX1 n=1 Tax=Dendrothele bispora (strain CBS 962.96) TaxID=1314807 RepID=A0A4V4HIX2_DENBC|nr:hypothetical protein K435DRAFT_740384 [Dendrothele bispora CBS 962.96]
MESTKTILNVHLASDSVAVLHLPYVLQVLTAEHLQPSSHLSKLTSRINSLLHSKDTGARWTGLCLAYRTSTLSKSFMIESGQGWLAVALPIISKKEPLPVVRAAVILCRAVFTFATDTPEFQRQVSTPNVPKFTAALITLLEKESDVELKVLILDTLAHLVPLYPNVHRASHSALTSLVTRILMESSSTYNSQCLVKPASKLYSILHCTGGKVGAANMWRKSVDDTLVAVWDAFHSLRTTFPDERGRIPGPSTHADLATLIATGVERLRSFVLTLCDLLKSTTQRPVNVPVGPIVKLVTAMITVTGDEQTEGSVDSNVRAMETLVMPSIWKLACDLIICLTRCVGHNMTPYLKRLVSYIVYHLEQKPPPVQRIPFLEALQTLLTQCHPLHDSILSTRLTKVISSFTSILLPKQSDTSNDSEKAAVASGGKKGKKRARAYEGDEVFNTSMEVICPAHNDGKALLTACDVMRLLLQKADASPPVCSIASRIILSALFYLPQTSPSLVSPDPRIYEQLVTKIQTIAIELGAGSTTAMSKSLPLVVRAASTAGLNDTHLHELDTLLHPRLPPFLRSLPAVEALALFTSEESNEEAQIRETLGLVPSSTSAILPPTRIEKDVTMADPVPVIQIPSTAAPPVPPVLFSGVTALQATIPLSTSHADSAQKQELAKIAQDAIPIATVPATVATSASASTPSTSTPILTVAPVTSTTFERNSTRVDAMVANQDADEEMPLIDIDLDSDSDSE